jgi:succinate dehydrogenase/fumarate reductase flavoprotein subunit
MWEYASIVRTEPGLLRGRKKLWECLEALRDCAIASPSDVAAALEIERMSRVGLAIVAAALVRGESRGAQYRSDCPDRDDARFMGSTRVWQSADGIRTDFVPLKG